MKDEINGVQYRYYPGLFILNDLGAAVEWLLSREATISFERKDDFDGIVDVSTTHGVNGRDFNIETRSRVVAGMEAESLFSAIDNHEVRVKCCLGAQDVSV